MARLSFKSIFILIAASIGWTAWAGAREVLLAKVDGAITPVTARFMVDAIDRAEAKSVECLIIELDTPGGLDDSMRTVIKRILVAKTPVVVYVAPAGSRAASAGAFITISAHVAAMAPGTSIGAAHPVSIMGQSMSIDTNMASKVVNDAAAYIRSIAEKRGRNIQWAETAVRESVSLSETEALQKKVIDLIAPTSAALLNQLEGRAVKLEAATKTLQTKGASIVTMEMNWRDRVLDFLANPNVAYLLFMLGLLGIYFELSNPGAILPGVIGVIALILAFFAFQMLSINYAGILLIILAIILFIVDVKAATHGILTAGGIIAMLIGSIMLFDAPDPAMRVSLQVMVPIVIVTSLFFILGIWLSMKSQFRQPTVGQSSLPGQEGDTRTAINARGGRVFVAGAHWNAVSEADIPEGARIRVVGVKGMTLTVKAIQ